MSNPGLCMYDKNNNWCLLCGYVKMLLLLVPRSEQLVYIRSARFYVHLFFSENENNNT